MINETKIKGGCQSGIKVAPHDSKSFREKENLACFLRGAVINRERVAIARVM